MPMRPILITLLLLACVATTNAQSSRKKKRTSRETEGAPTTLDPYYPEQKQRERKMAKKNKSSGPTYNAERAYYERLEDLEKEKRKEEKEMLKPQYSNPMYFGHKRPPKKRPPHKMKLCKVCGIRH